MFGLSFEVKSDLEKIFFGKTVERNYVREDNDTFRKGPCFVEKHVSGFIGEFEGLGIFNEDAFFCADTRRDHNSCRCGKTQRAGAGNDEDAHE